jgi:hypothetical protein
LRELDRGREKFRQEIGSRAEHEKIVGHAAGSRGPVTTLDRRAVAKIRGHAVILRGQQGVGIS